MPVTTKCPNCYSSSFEMSEVMTVSSEKLRFVMCSNCDCAISAIPTLLLKPDVVKECHVLYSNTHAVNEEL